MNAASLREHLSQLDAALSEPARACVYGSAALMLLGQDDRFSLDMDVAGPYSEIKEPSFSVAAAAIGWPVNPGAEFTGDHIEWVSSLRLCLAPPSPDDVRVLWQGRHLTVFTLPPADLVASRLIRYDPTDQADIQFLLIQTGVHFSQVAEAVERLPMPFRNDLLVRENLENLRRDMERWTA